MTIRLPTAIVLAAMTVSGGAMAQNNDTQFRSTTLTLSAQGEVRIPPDVATLNLGVLREEATAQAATASSSRILSAVTKALTGSGVAPRDVQTQSIRLTPRFSNAANQAREIVAYQSSGGVTVRLRDLARAGALIDAAVAAGVNQVSGPNFSVENRPPLERQARDQALRALNEEAARVADVMGQRVVRLVTVNTQAYVLSPLMERSVVMGAAPAPPPPLPIPSVQGFDPGEIVIRAAANGSFELAPK